MKRYYRITYQWPPGCRGATSSIVAVDSSIGSKLEMIDEATKKLNQHIGQEVRVLDCNKLPSNYKAQDQDIIE